MQDAFLATKYRLAFMSDNVFDLAVWKRDENRISHLGSVPRSLGVTKQSERFSSKSVVLRLYETELVEA